MKDEDLEQEPLEEGMGEEEVASFSAMVQDQLQYLPWWLISIVLHTIILCLSMLISMGHPQTQVVMETDVGIEQELKDKDEPQPETKKQEVPQETQKPLEQEEPEVKDPIVKEAKVSDHVETANNETNPQAKGDPEAHSDSPLIGRFDKSDIGVGGRTAGMFGDRLSGGKENLVKERGGSPKTQNSVMMGLLWLKRHQGEDGRWDSDGFLSLCGRDNQHPGSCGDGAGESWCDVGVTGLALLCFLGAGNSTSVGEFQEQVKKGVQYLTSVTDSEGCIGTRQGHLMYNHAIGTLAMAEAYSMSNYNPLLKTPTEKAVKFLLDAQNPNKGWRYTPRCNDSDTSVTGWCVMALKSAKVGSIEVPESAFTGAKAFLDDVTETTYYRAGYTKKDEAVQPSGFAQNESLTAVAMTSRVFMGLNDRNDPYLVKGAELLMQSLPRAGNNERGENMVDYYYWYYGTLAMFQMGQDYWTAWNDKMKDAIANTQETTGCKAGSWPLNDRWTKNGGRIYATALNVLSLEIYYRYDKVFK
jgi:hypothetical protein